MKGNCSILARELWMKGQIVEIYVEQNVRVGAWSYVEQNGRVGAWSYVEQNGRVGA
jgi:hypothetical protein